MRVHYVPLALCEVCKYVSGYPSVMKGTYKKHDQKRYTIFVPNNNNDSYKTKDDV